MSQFGEVFKHIPHPYTRERMAGSAPPPPRVDDERVGLNGRLGLFVTAIVGTMWAAYLFAILALVSFPSAIREGSTLVIVAWIAQTFLQLVLLPVIIVGQNIQGKASDKRAEQTYKDAEAILHELTQVQAHLAAQDEVRAKQIGELREILGQLR